MNRKLPRLEAMTDIEAIHWYCREVRKLVEKRHWNEEDKAHHKALLAWKENLNKRLEANRMRMWE